MADRGKKTIYIGGIGEEVDESVLYATFSTFGDVVDLQIPKDGANKPRGFAFVQFDQAEDARAAIDNMHLNELGNGRVIKVNLAKPFKGGAGSGNRPIWQDEEWIKQYAKPLGQEQESEAAEAAVAAAEGDENAAE